MERPRAWAALKEDLRRYIDPRWSLPRKIRRVLVTRELWVIWIFRWGSYTYFEAPRLLAPLHKLFWRPWNDFLQTLLDTHVEPESRIGPGFFIGHTGGIWINPNSRLGSMCNVAQGVVIGVAGGGKAPLIGDRVWIGPHAVITGAVRVGNAAVVGANSLVVGDVADNAVVLGVPAKVLSYSGSGRLVHWAGEDKEARPAMPTRPKPTSPAAASDADGNGSDPAATAPPSVPAP